MSVVLSFVLFPEVLMFLFDSIHGLFACLPIFPHAFILLFLPSIFLNLCIYPSTIGLSVCASLHDLCIRFVHLDIHTAHLFTVSIEGFSMYKTNIEESVYIYIYHIYSDASVCTSHIYQSQSISLLNPLHPRNLT